MKIVSVHPCPICTIGSKAPVSSPEAGGRRNSHPLDRSQVEVGDISKWSSCCWCTVSKCWYGYAADGPSNLRKNEKGSVHICLVVKSSAQNGSVFLETPSAWRAGRRRSRDHQQGHDGVSVVFEFLMAGPIAKERIGQLVVDFSGSRHGQKFLSLSVPGRSLSFV